MTAIRRYDLGNVIRVRKATTGGYRDAKMTVLADGTSVMTGAYFRVPRSTTWRVSLNGKLVDSFEKRSRAFVRARALIPIFEGRLG